MSPKENQNIEWKELWKDEYLKWICGFANSQGGILIIGKNDKGEITGIKDAKNLMETIPNKIKDILGIIVEVKLKVSEGREYIEIVVEAYPSPISYKGRYYVRSGSTKQELKGTALDTFIMRKYGLNWDDSPVPYLLAEKLDKDAFDLFTRKGVKSKRLEEDVLQDDIPALLNKLCLFNGSYLKRAAALLFCKDPEEYITGAFVKIGFFRSNTDLIYQDQVYGNLFEQVDKTMDLLTTKYMKAYISYEGIQRIERFLFPAIALREAVTNAILHKDYSSGNPIQISVYEDHLIIWNAAQISDELPLERLLGKHPSIPHNPSVARAFFRAGYIEAWGRGIEKIKDECKFENAPEPFIEYSFGGVMITFTNQVPEFARESSPNTMEKKVGESSPISSPISSPKTEKEILKLMKQNPLISTTEIGDMLNISKRAVLKQTKKLQEKGLLERIGSAKGGHWKVMENMP